MGHPHQLYSIAVAYWETRCEPKHFIQECFGIHVGKKWSHWRSGEPTQLTWRLGWQTKRKASEYWRLVSFNRAFLSFALVLFAKSVALFRDYFRTVRGKFHSPSLCLYIWGLFIFNGSPSLNSSFSVVLPKIWAMFFPLGPESSLLWPILPYRLHSFVCTNVQVSTWHRNVSKKQCVILLCALHDACGIFSELFCAVPGYW